MTMCTLMINPSESWYFDRSSVDTPIDGFEWTPWFKLSPSVQNLRIERPVETQFDPSGPRLPNATNDQRLGGHAYLDPCFVEYDWELYMTTFFFILNPFVTYTVTNTDGSLLYSDSFDVTEDTKILMSLETLMNSCLSQLNADYQEARGITSSHQEAIAWNSGNVGDTVTWSANDYAPDLEFVMTAENMNVPMTINDDKRGGSFGPLYSKDSVYNDSVWVNTSRIVVGLEGYSETRTVTIERGSYRVLTIAYLIRDGFNAIDGTQVFTREKHRGEVQMAPRSGVYPSMIVISNDNPYLPLTPGIIRRINFTFHRNWYIRMPELTTPYEFALANIDGLTATNMINGHTYSNREMTVTFKQPTRVAYVGSPSFTSADNVDWEQPQSYMASTTMRFPYGVMTLDNKNTETDITYMDDTVNHTWTIPSRMTQADLVWRLNQCFNSAALNIQWTPESDGYYIHADYVFSLNGNLGMIIPASGSQPHT